MRSVESFSHFGTGVWACFGIANISGPHCLTTISIEVAVGALRAEDYLVHRIVWPACIQLDSVVEDTAGRRFASGRLPLTEVYQHLGGDTFISPTTTRCEGELTFLIVARFEADIHLIFNLPDRQHGEVRICSRAAVVTSPSLTPA